MIAPVLMVRSGMVESRIRTLVQDLENTDNILTAHPQCGGISGKYVCLTEEEQAAASQGELSLDAMKRTEGDVQGEEFKKVFTKNFFIGLEIEKKPSEFMVEREIKPDTDHFVCRGRARKSSFKLILPEQAVLRCLSGLGQVRRAGDECDLTAREEVSTCYLSS